ncbi:MAG TPA: MFS transporter [Candidatus Angelobacter sp.]|nr:MFS transporter [Candidatus Angelobacter sp.]
MAVLVLVNVVNFYDRHLAGALAEPLRREFSLTDTQLGLLSTFFTLLYAVIGLPLGRMADRGSRKKLLAGGLAIWGAFTTFAGWAWNFPSLLISRLGLAVGEAACAPTATSWIGDLFPAQRRSRPLALFMLGVPIGGALSYFFSGPIAQFWGWRRAMLTAGIPALLLAPVLLFVLEPKRGTSETATRPQEGSVRQVLRVPAFWWIVASGILVNFVLYALATFMPALFGRVHHVQVGAAGVATGVVYLIGGVLGGTVGGFWGDSIVHRRADGRMLVAAMAAAAAAPLAFLGLRQPLGMLPLAIVLLTPAYGLLNMYYGLVYASLQDIVAPSLRATAMAIYFLFMYLGGASFGPQLTGKLSDHLAHRAAIAAGSSGMTEAARAVGLQEAMLVIPILCLALALVLWAGSRSMLMVKGVEARSTAV